VDLTTPLLLNLLLLYRDEAGSMRINVTIRFSGRRTDWRTYVALRSNLTSTTSLLHHFKVKDSLISEATSKDRKRHS
jgi:hypothetical protein